MRHSPRTVVDDGLSEEDKLLSAVTRYKPESGSHKELLSDLDLGDYGEGEKEEVSFDELLGYDNLILILMRKGLNLCGQLFSVLCGDKKSVLGIYVVSELTR